MYVLDLPIVNSHKTVRNVRQLDYDDFTKFHDFVFMEIYHRSSISHGHIVAKV